jgi:alkylation response protein AidB-like acyl-CoA dehydrogenase
MIDLVPTDDQKAIAEGVAAFLDDKLSLERFRAAGQGAPDDHWAELAELGALGISVPEAAGGVGAGLPEDLLVFREFGRRLLSPAVLATRLAAGAAAAAGDGALCEALLAGRRRAGLATPADGAWQLVDAGEDDLVVVVDEDAVRVFEPAALTGRKPLTGLDATVALAGAQITGAPRLTGEARLALTGVLFGAAMLCGVLEAIRDMAAEYAKTRKQFGLPIGVFQGVKHPCADMALAAEAAWSQTAFAAVMLEAEATDARFHVMDAKMVAGDGALDAARANIQIHGGMGFTEELDAHLLMKRAHLLRRLFQDPRTAPRALLDMVLDI